MVGDGGDPGITEAYFLDAFGGWITLVGGMNILFEHRAYGGEPGCEIAGDFECSRPSASVLIAMARLELQLALHLDVKLAQRRIEGLTDEVVDSLVAQIGPAKVSREQEREKPIEDCVQRFPRGHFMDALLLAALLRARAGGAQLSDDSIELPRRVRQRVAVFLMIGAHAARPVALEDCSATSSNSAVLR